MQPPKEGRENQTKTATKQEEQPAITFMSAKEEFTLLLKSIEENSKQARKIMFALVLACMYALLAVFLPSMSADLEQPINQRGVEKEPPINLPVINVKVPNRMFFFCTPLVILIAYLYLHIYIHELRKRLDSTNKFLQTQEFVVSDSNNLLFPWIAVFAFQYKNKYQRLSNQEKKVGDHPVVLRDKKSSPYEILVGALTNFLLWSLGPLALLILWIIFVGQEDSVSIIPCICFVFALWTASITAVKPSRTPVKILMVFFSIGIVFLTLISVPTFRKNLKLYELWFDVKHVWESFLNSMTAWWTWIPIIVIVIQLLPAIIWIVLRPFGRLTLRMRLVFHKFLINLNIPGLICLFLSKLFFAQLRTNRRLMGIPGVIRGNLLKGFNLSYFDLKDVSFENADFSGNFYWSSTNFGYTKLKRSKLINANLKNCYFLCADLEEAHLNRANLSGAYLVGANLSGADLSGANLFEASLGGADLSGANLFEANLFEANLSGAIELTIEQLSNVKTLYHAELDPKLKKQVKEKYPHLLKKPKEEEGDKRRSEGLPGTKKIGE